MTSDSGHKDLWLYDIRQRFLFLHKKQNLSYSKKERESIHILHIQKSFINFDQKEVLENHLQPSLNLSIQSKEYQKTRQSFSSHSPSPVSNGGYLVVVLNRLLLFSKNQLDTGASPQLNKHS